LAVSASLGSEGQGLPGRVRVRRTGTYGTGRYGARLPYGACTDLSRSCTAAWKRAPGLLQGLPKAGCCFRPVPHPPHYPPEAMGEGLQMEESDGKHARACPAAAPLLRSVPRAPQRGCPPLLVVNSVLSPMSPPPTHSSTLLKPLGKGCKWGILTGGIRGAGKRGVIGAAARRVGHNVATRKKERERGRGFEGIHGFRPCTPL
jgi:hypothetical protein